MPYDRYLHSFTRDPVSGRFIVFGGWFYPRGGETPPRFLGNNALFLNSAGFVPAAVARAAGRAARIAPLGSPAPRAAAAAPRIALARLRMISARELSFVATLPDATPAQLEVFDVSGRRLASAAIGGRSGARAASIQLSTGLAPGLYLARVQQANAQALGRFVVLR
jgi:hypothetical protein